MAIIRTVDKKKIEVEVGGAKLAATCRRFSGSLRRPRPSL